MALLNSFFLNSSLPSLLYTSAIAETRNGNYAFRVLYSIFITPFLKVDSVLPSVKAFVSLAFGDMTGFLMTEDLNVC